MVRHFLEGVDFPCGISHRVSTASWVPLTRGEILWSSMGMYRNRLDSKVKLGGHANRVLLNHITKFGGAAVWISSRSRRLKRY